MMKQKGLLPIQKTVSVHHRQTDAVRLCVMLPGQLDH